MESSHLPSSVNALVSRLFFVKFDSKSRRLYCDSIGLASARLAQICTSDCKMKFIQALAYVLSVASATFAQSDDANKAVAMINQARQSKGLQPLIWHPDLATYAQYWADRMGSNQEPFHHASGQLRPSQGETLFQEQSTQCDPAYDTPLQSGVTDWLSQEPLYNGQPISTGQEPWLHYCKFSW